MVYSRISFGGEGEQHLLPLLQRSGPPLCQVVTSASLKVTVSALSCPLPSCVGSVFSSQRHRNTIQDKVFLGSDGVHGNPPDCLFCFTVPSRCECPGFKGPNSTFPGGHLCLPSCVGSVFSSQRHRNTTPGGGVHIHPPTACDPMEPDPARAGPGSLGRKLKVSWKYDCIKVPGLKQWEGPRLITSYWVLKDIYKTYSCPITNI